MSTAAPATLVPQLFRPLLTRRMGPYLLTLTRRGRRYVGAVKGPGIHLTLEVDPEELAPVIRAGVVRYMRGKGIEPEMLAGNIFEDVGSWVKKTAKKAAKSKALKGVLSAAAAITSHPAVAATLQTTLGPAGAVIPAAFGAANAGVQGDARGAAKALVLAATANLGPMGGMTAAAAGPIVDSLIKAKAGDPVERAAIARAGAAARQGHPRAVAMVAALRAADRAIGPVPPPPRPVRPAAPVALPAHAQPRIHFAPQFAPSFGPQFGPGYGAPVQYPAGPQYAPSFAAPGYYAAPPPYENPWVAHFQALLASARH